MLLNVNHLTCEFRNDPLGIDEKKPLLQWQLRADGYGAGQTAYRVCVASAPECLNAPDIWDSGRVESIEMRAIYAGRALLSDEKVYWRVCVWDKEGERSAWSETANWRQGISHADWTGSWIGWDEGRDQYDPSKPYYCADDFDLGESEPFLPKPALLRGEFVSEGEAVSATLYVSAMGLAEMYLNGARAVEGHLIPGISDFRKRVYYRAYDVTGLVRTGANALSAVLADGWYAGYIGLNPRQWWGAKPRLNAELHIAYADGSRQVVTTDASWRGCVGAYLYADIMHGMGYDATLEPTGWQLAGYDASAWHPVETGAEYDLIPSAHPGVSICAHGRWPVKEIRRINDNEAMIDAGRCLSGVLRIVVRGPRGARVDLYHAEQLEMDGSELYFRGNRSARQHDCYILAGEGEEVFQPEFTYHGFRYAHIYGLKDEIGRAHV